MVVDLETAVSPPPAKPAGDHSDTRATAVLNDMARRGQGSSGLPDIRVVGYWRIV